MKTTTVLFVAALAAECVAAPLGLGMGIGDGVRVGSSGAIFQLTLHHEGWTGTSTGVRKDRSLPDLVTCSAPFELFNKKEKCGHGVSTLLQLADGRALYSVTVNSDVDQNPAALVLSLVMPSKTFACGTWKMSNGKSGTLPEKFSNMTLCSGVTKSISFSVPAVKENFTILFPEDTYCMIQDDRRWGPTFTLRVSPHAPREFRKGDQRNFTCILSAPDGVKTEIDRPVKISKGKDWIPLDYRKNIEPGSALDFSGMGLQDAPAGKYGWLRNANGHFEFEGKPGVHQRFYGVNLCFSASFPDKELADELVMRLVRLGYNTVRIHHYEGRDGVIKESKDRLTLNEEWTKRLDYLLYRAMEKGIYVTTDLFTTRPVMWRDIAIDRAGQVPQQVYKNLIGIHEPAFENWKTFSRNLLTHVNPYTGRAYKDEPGLPLISLINEGNLIWCWNKINGEAPMKAAWKKWLAAKRAADPSFAKGVSENSEKITDSNSAALICFMADVENDLSRRQREFLRALGVKALFTSQNCGRHYTPLMAMREERYDYVDDHFYVDHPQFVAQPWRLPSKCPNTNPVFSTRLPPVACAYTRMLSKPFCITEWNFSGPGMFRGVGGIMTGAMGALQDWDGLWRFAYSHTEEGLRDRAGIPGYFDVASDPLGQASDRASICLFLRGDMAPLTDKLALQVTPDTFMPKNGRPTGVVPEWLDAAWQTQVGTVVAPAPASVKTFNLGEQIAKTNAPVSLAANRAIAFDRTAGSFSIDTPRTAGGFSPKGTLSSGPISFDVGDIPATVWASSLDGKPIANSARILVTHLTDVQADGNVYADKTKTTLFNWGSYPPLVRNGSADVTLTLADPGAYSVWELASSGKRLGKVPSSVCDGKLAFKASVEGAHGARMLYEVTK